MAKTHVMFIDELSEIADKFGSNLIENNYDVNVAHNLHEAFHYVKKNKPNVIVVSDTFHKRSGYDICSDLRGEIDTCYATIILLLPPADITARRHASEVGVNEVMTKNIQPRDLLMKIETLLKDR